MKKRIYLDNNATTPLDPRVLEAMLPTLKEVPLNPSSIHFFGQEAKKLLVTSRKKIADYLSVRPSEIIFTSSGTEALNLLIQPLQGHIISTALEHPAIYNTISTN